MGINVVISFYYHQLHYSILNFYPVSDDKKFKIGLRIDGEGETVSAYERDNTPSQFYDIVVTQTDGSASHATCLEYGEYT